MPTLLLFLLSHRHQLQKMLSHQFMIPTWTPERATQMGGREQVAVNGQLRQLHLLLRVQILAEAILLGFQHYLVMLGTAVLIFNALVTHLGGRHAEKSKVIQTFLFVAGLNTLAQTVFGTRLAVMGGSYTFVLPAFSIIVAGRHLDIVDPHKRFKQTMRGMQGSLIVASILQITVGFSGCWGNTPDNAASCPHSCCSSYHTAINCRRCRATNS